VDAPAPAPAAVHVMPAAADGGGLGLNGSLADCKPAHRTQDRALAAGTAKCTLAGGAEQGKAAAAGQVAPACSNGVDVGGGGKDPDKVPDPGCSCVIC
jgi:hypothetical protein